MTASHWISHITQKHWAPESEEDYAERIANGTGEKLYYFIIWSKIHPACVLTAIFCWVHSILFHQSQQFVLYLKPLFEHHLGEASDERWMGNPKQKEFFIMNPQRGPGDRIQRIHKLELKKIKLHHLFSLSSTWNLVFNSNINASTKP